MMYPASGDDYSRHYEHDTRHCVYNAPYDINDDASKIAAAFIDFIKGEIASIEGWPNEKQ